MAAYRIAIKQIQDHFNTKWLDGIANGLPLSNPVLAPLSFGYTPKIYWTNIEDVASLPTNEHFAIFFSENLTTQQISLPGGRNDGSCVKFNTPGVGIIQLFFSKSNYSTEEQDQLEAIAQEMFMGTRTTNVWFKNPSIRPLKPMESFFRTNVTFEYEFDTHIQSPVN